MHEIVRGVFTKKTLFTRIALWDSTIRVNVKTIFKQKFSVRLLVMFTLPLFFCYTLYTTFDSFQ